MGVVNIIFTLVAIFTVDRFGRKPLLIIGSIGMALGAFAFCFVRWHGCERSSSCILHYRLRSILHDVMGPYLLGTHFEIFPNTIRGKSGSKLGGFPMGV